MALGHHKMEYEVLEGWEQLPEGWLAEPVLNYLTKHRLYAEP